MNNKMLLASLFTGAILLSGCGENVKQVPVDELLSGASLTEDQLHASIIGNTFSAHVKSGPKAGRYTFEYKANGELTINQKHIRQWSITDGALCVESCAKYYQGAENTLLGVQDGKILVALSPK